MGVLDPQRSAVTWRTEGRRPGSLENNGFSPRRVLGGGLVGGGTGFGSWPGGRTAWTWTWCPLELDPHRPCRGPGLVPPSVRGPGCWDLCPAHLSGPVLTGTEGPSFLGQRHPPRCRLHTPSSHWSQARLFRHTAQCCQCPSFALLCVSASITSVHSCPTPIHPSTHLAITCFPFLK